MSVASKLLLKASLRGGRLVPTVMAAVAVLGFILVALALWPSLPPVNQDEYLSMLPITWFDKPAEARPAELLPYSRQLFGELVPLRSYPHIGSLKAFVYHALDVPMTVDGYRAVNAAFIAVSVATFVWAAAAATPAAVIAGLVATAFLLADSSLLLLGITDEGPVAIGLILAAALLVLIRAELERPVWWRAVAIGAVVFLGVWDRLNFTWYLAASVAAVAAASIGRERSQCWRPLVHIGLAMAVGLLALYALIPDYLRTVLTGFDADVLPTSPGALGVHLGGLIGVVDPFHAYHRYVVTNPNQPDAIYVVYRVGFCVAFVVAMLGNLCLGALRLRAGSDRATMPLFAGGFVAGLFVVISITGHAWASHHIIVAKPFVYFALAVLIAELPGPRAVFVAVTALVVAFCAYTGARGLSDLRTAPPESGIYGVTWNAVDAWSAAAASPNSTIYALDWGVFYPGLVNSWANQRWEMAFPNTAEDLWGLTHGRPGIEIGMLFRAESRYGQLADAANPNRRDTIVATDTFDDHAGDAWVLQTIRNDDPGKNRPILTAAVGNLIRRPTFAMGRLAWTYEKTGAGTDSAQIAFTKCGRGKHQCALLLHGSPTDSRLVQDVVLEAGSTYEISAQARVQGVARSSVGAHLTLMKHSQVRSIDLRGDTGWHELGVYVVTGREPVTVRVAVRLGSYGSVTTGVAWFTRVVVREVANARPGMPVFEIEPAG